MLFVGAAVEVYILMRDYLIWGLKYSMRKHNGDSFS